MTEAYIQYYQHLSITYKTFIILLVLTGFTVVDVH